MGFSRRDFLLRIGQAGGFGAAFITMQHLGLMPMPEALAEPKLALASGNGTKVVILGGGIAGLVAAYEMGKAGYSCTVLEARKRPGGRNFTVRNDTKIEFTDGMTQTASWEDASYFNAGPARLPSIHKTMLGYCKELGVPLEVEVNTSRSALLQSDDAFGGKAVEQRQAINDTRGHVSELLAKCIKNSSALDQQMTKEDTERMLAFLKTYGDLQPDYSYTGSERSGVEKLPGAGPDAEVLRAPLSMHSLLDANFWMGMMYEEMFDMQATMFQPVGGMDRIPYAFAKKLGDVVQYGSPVKEIRKTANGVKVSYSDASGAARMIEADYCICALPITILKDIPNDFAPRVKQAIHDVGYDSAYKVAWESRRFWEQDYNLYGGLGFVIKGPVNLMWYPSGKIFSENGVLVAGYGVENQSEFGKLPSIQAKFDASRAAVEKLHPGHGKELKNPMYMNWGMMPYNLGSWVGAAPSYVKNRRGEYYDGPYKEFTQPDDRIYFSGDHCSHIIGWQEGAALASHRAASMISERVKMARLSSATTNQNA